MINGHKYLVRECEAKGPLRRTRRRYEDNIKTDLKKLGVWV